MPLCSLNGAVLHYRVRGSGPPLLLVHPPLLSRACFHYQEEALADEFQIITLDLRGHGHSGQSKVPLSYALLASDMAALVDHLGLASCYLCGYSTGAGVVLEALLAYPDRFAGAVLISAMSEAGDPLLRAKIALAMRLAASKASARLLRLGIVSGNADRASTFIRLMREARRANLPDVQRYFASSLAYRATERLAEIEVPVLLLYGGKDRAFRRYRLLLQRRLKQYDSVILDKEEHQLPTKSPHAVNAWIRRWLRVQTRPSIPLTAPEYEHSPELTGWPLEEEMPADSEPHSLQ
ncbi:alpha/beta hydrolase [Paenibacillus sp. IB182496]|uniref:Alpha/beta hydrolase n=1 Tax=Paenibacillus sabuli TaxID=2772509 RepID=A0A927BQ00_9BACL|nr:alpha/beta hydrolase [Paenibacillus sabuli]MBD2844586.1 alpha/beta hydrolase [Paenibacillus sabuli]